MSASFSGWAILELMGHRQRPGFVEEVELAGGKLLRVDIPAADGSVMASELYGCAAIYCLRPVTEEVARDAAKRMGDVRPLRPVDYRSREESLPHFQAAPAADMDEGGPF